jgi:hypothetical protein
VGKGKRADVYLEVRKRRGIYVLNETSACGLNNEIKCIFYFILGFADLA